MTATTTTDWRDTLRDATDLALVGILVTVAAVPVVTTGAAVAVGAEAVHLRFTDGRWPGPRDVLRTFGRRLLPGALATLAVLAVALLLGLNIFWLRQGLAPGGELLLGLTAVVGAALIGLVALAIPFLGRAYTYRSALRTALSRPALIVTCAGVIGIAFLIGSILPVTAPLLVGYVLLALHTIARRVPSAATA
ncbi:hypothetical protein [Catellatospora citrea]|uniref:Uncharacterized protein n=1 Tax=Catellatospora citrea TaxID=53366 RepID=A0A8J3NYP3_9ACTN|nr:hypothetical protein [Catellatospora citrea]RKE09535.1 hypothetical protein C8E86_4425 [Catellatospora citrea]GIF97497.1 hypothetical protein Cci01nite_25910 [Catellatospora citrea]